MNVPHKVTPAVTSEVFLILKQKKERKESQHQSAEYRKKDTLEKIEKLYIETQSWFHRLHDVGVKHQLLTQLTTIDFGVGAEEIEFQTQAFSLEDIGNILVLTPYYCDDTQRPLQFNAILPNSEYVNLIFWPHPHKLKLNATWYIFENGSDSLAEASYKEFNEELVMTLLKERISE
ncbi:hypothetical protein V0R50_21260 [Pseudomonas sp. 148P]|uniref:Uncharacterized protein n=1 Tax=Pseudomonas ulcerans TaxID=3115852 RepID=A0ABU7HW53_9PSED|nr:MULTISPECIES: hypothetical protein [unclassified Pseudomonas]MEE1922916.1 hypothetical protein [Pseudomonas sp. 147P]MEE1935766.1 hypothetical protein [Pseudomonas sp. 148P]